MSLYICVLLLNRFWFKVCMCLYICLYLFSFVFVCRCIWDCVCICVSVFVFLSVFLFIFINSVYLFLCPGKGDRENSKSMQSCILQVYIFASSSYLPSYAFLFNSLYFTSLFTYRNLFLAQYKCVFRCVYIFLLRIMF